MLREITREEAKKKVFNDNVFVMQLLEEPTETTPAKLTFTPIANFGTPKQILSALSDSQCRFLEEATEIAIEEL